MKSKIVFLAIAAAWLLLPGCSKNSGTKGKTKTELISTGSWKFSTATVGGADVAAFLQTCQKDNIVTLQASGNGSLDEGTSKCNSGDPQTNSFTWNFASNEAILHISTILFSGGSNDFTLVSLSGTQLVASQNVTVGGSSQMAVVTFIH